MKLKTLSLVLACTLMSTAFAAEPSETNSAEQEATKAEIDSLISRIELLSKKLGPSNEVNITVRRHGTERAPVSGAQDVREVIIERQMDPTAKPRIEVMRPKPGVGIVMAPNSAANGVVIGAVTPEGPAAKAGLRSGDVLLSVNGKNIGSSGRDGVNKARELLSDLKVGQSVQLTYAREGKTGKANVKVESIRRVMMFTNREGGFSPRADGQQRRTMASAEGRGNVEIFEFTQCEKSGKKDCATPRIFEALRWQGLNLASLDTQLGHYFGTEKGVLVISAGPSMKNLQGGDVIQRVETTTTQSPRDVMRVLREKKVGEKVSLNVLRDRKPLNIEITVPELKVMPFLPPPPAPPAPPPPPAPPLGMGLNEYNQGGVFWVSQHNNSGENSLGEVEIAR